MPPPPGLIDVNDDHSWISRQNERMVCKRHAGAMIQPKHPFFVVALLMSLTYTSITSHTSAMASWLNTWQSLNPVQKTGLFSHTAALAVLVWNDDRTARGQIGIDATASISEEQHAFLGSLLVTQ